MVETSKKERKKARLVGINFKLKKLSVQTQEICSRLQRRWKESRVSATSTYKYI